MTRISYVNGAYVPHHQAAVAVDDRGYHFSDAVYEVMAVVNGTLLDSEMHLKRLHRSLGELSIEFGMPDAVLLHIFRQVIRRNRIRTGTVYIQVSRGVAPRDHAFPKGPVKPALLISAKRMDLSRVDAWQRDGVRVMTVPESRWSRPDIKSTSLLANVLAKQAARDAGALEAWFVGADGHVTEGTSCNAWIVTKDGRLVTRNIDGRILAGITRAAVIETASSQGLRIEERAFTVDEAKAAAEAFLTSTTSFVSPVVNIDGADIGDGAPGPVTREAIATHWRHVEDQTGYRHEPVPAD